MVGYTTAGINQVTIQGICHINANGVYMSDGGHIFPWEGPPIMATMGPYNSPPPHLTSPSQLMPATISRTCRNSSLFEQAR